METRIERYFAKRVANVEEMHAVWPELCGDVLNLKDRVRRLEANDSDPPPPNAPPALLRDIGECSPTGIYRIQELVRKELALERNRGKVRLFDWLSRNAAKGASHALVGAVAAGLVLLVLALVRALH